MGKVGGSGGALVFSKIKIVLISSSNQLVSSNTR